MLFREFFRLLKLGMLHVLLSTLLFFQFFSDSQNKNQAQAKTLPVMMTLFQRNCLVPMTSLNQQIVISTCRRIASRFQCYLLIYFKMNDKRKTSCVLICLCCTSLQISFFSLLVPTYIKCIDISFQGEPLA